MGVDLQHETYSAIYPPRQEVKLITKCGDVHVDVRNEAGDWVDAEYIKPVNFYGMTTANPKQTTAVHIED
jgi:hypothetical protein